MRRRLLPVIVSAVFVAMPACGFPIGPRPIRPGSEFFGTFRTFNDPQPPQNGLELWVEGDSLTPDAGGRAAAWPDMRPGMGGLRAWRANDGTMMSGAVTTPMPALRTPIGMPRDTHALVCATGSRCSYVLVDAAGNARTGVLTGQPYAIFALVRRSGPRGSNYVVMTDGTGCIPSAGGTGCTSNTVLHLGWSAANDIRLGQYDNDVDYTDGPRFNRAAPALTMLAGRLNVGGKTIAILEALYDTSAHTSDSRPLDRSGRLFVGGTPWVDANPVPDWRFEGEIYAVLVYAAELTSGEIGRAADYLRNRYGPR